MFRYWQRQWRQQSVEYFQSVICLFLIFIWWAMIYRLILSSRKKNSYSTPSAKYETPKCTFCSGWKWDQIEARKTDKTNKCSPSNDDWAREHRHSIKSIVLLVRSSDERVFATNFLPNDREKQVHKSFWDSKSTSHRNPIEIDIDDKNAMMNSRPKTPFSLRLDCIGFHVSASQRACSIYESNEWSLVVQSSLAIRSYCVVRYTLFRARKTNELIKCFESKPSIILVFGLTNINLFHTEKFIAKKDL